MKVKSATLFLLVTAIGLLGARCNPSTTPQVTAAVNQAVITTGVKANNEPENNLTQIAAGTNTIYLSVEVVHPPKRTSVQVAWYKMPNQILTTENFDGNRGTDVVDRFNFDAQLGSSWLASQADKPGASWPLGDYKAEVRVNNKLAKTAFFSVVSDAEADQAAAAKSLKEISFGDAITGDNQISAPKSTFYRDTNNIYLQVTTDSPADTNLQVSVRYLKEDKPFNTFNAVVNGSDTQLYTLSRNRFGKLWPDGLWPIGSFEVVVRINGAIAKTTNFFVR